MYGMNLVVVMNVRILLDCGKSGFFLFWRNEDGEMFRYSRRQAALPTLRRKIYCERMGEPASIGAVMNMDLVIESSSQARPGCLDLVKIHIFNLLVPREMCSS